MEQEKRLPTRREYLENKVTFEEYYSSVAKEAGINLKSWPELPRIKRALLNGDTHLNSIRLSFWDVEAGMFKGPLVRAFKAHGDYYSLAGGVCALKQAARNAARESE